MTSNPLSRCVWTAFIEKSQSRSSSGVGGSGVERQGRCCMWNSPEGKCAAIEGRGQGKRADLWHNQHNRQLRFPWQPVASLSRLSLGHEIWLYALGSLTKWAFILPSDRRRTPESGLESESGSDFTNICTWILLEDDDLLTVNKTNKQALIYELFKIRYQDQLPLESAPVVETREKHIYSSTVRAILRCFHFNAKHIWKAFKMQHVKD